MILRKNTPLFLNYFLSIALWVSSGYIIGKLAVKIVDHNTSQVFERTKDSSIASLDSLEKIFEPINMGFFSKNKIKIIGVVANSDFGSILVTINDGPIKIFNVGEKSEENLIFEGINDGVVRFSHNEKFFEMPFLSVENKVIENK